MDDVTGVVEGVGNGNFGSTATIATMSLGYHGLRYGFAKFLLGSRLHCLSLPMKTSFTIVSSRRVKYSTSIPVPRENLRNYGRS